MKKALTLALLLMLSVSSLSGCSSQGGAGTGSASVENSSLSQSAPFDEEKPTPIHGDRLVDGSYEITVDSSSSMFRVVRCVLTVEDGNMTAAMTMSGQGYGMVYMGTGEEAAQDSEEHYVPFVLEESGEKTFAVPVEALDVETDCAAWSIRKEKWYDRVLVFESAGLPAEAFRVG